MPWCPGLSGDAWPRGPWPTRTRSAGGETAASRSPAPAGRARASCSAPCPGERPPSPPTTTTTPISSAPRPPLAGRRGPRQPVCHGGDRPLPGHRRPGLQTGPQAQLGRCVRERERERERKKGRASEREREDGWMESEKKKKTHSRPPSSRPHSSHPSSTGLSLQSQYLTAAFLATRLACSFMMEYDIHTALDFATLGATGWVIWQLRGPCAGTFQADQDSLAWFWVVRFLGEEGGRGGEEGDGRARARGRTRRPPKPHAPCFFSLCPLPPSLPGRPLPGRRRLCPPRHPPPPPLPGGLGGLRLHGGRLRPAPAARHAKGESG